jgi:hypothetical protein
VGGVLHVDTFAHNMLDCLCAPCVASRFWLHFPCLQGGEALREAHLNRVISLLAVFWAVV